MQYEAPEMLELGSVEDLTFGGEVWPSADSFTGLRGFYYIEQAAADEE